MQHAAVLHVAVGAHPYGVHIAAQNGIHPHAGVFAQLYFPQNLGGKVDIA